MRTTRTASTEGFLRNFGPLGVLLLAPATSATADALADPGCDRLVEGDGGRLRRGDLGARRR